MKDCVYFERLISCKLDEPLSLTQEQKLQAHLNECNHCQLFEKLLKNQSMIVQNLPKDSLNRNLTPVITNDKKTSFFQKVWSKSICIPVPVAAVLALLFLSWGTFSVLKNNNTSGVNEYEQAKLPAEEVMIEYVQVERLEPQTAVVMKIQ